MSIFNSMNVSATGLTAERLRMDTISNNIANANSTRTVSGAPYRRKIVVFKEKEPSEFQKMLNISKSKYNTGAGVEVKEITEDMSDFKRVYNPSHPDADKDGYVLMPNVNVISEMINLMTATRAYEANVSVITSTKAMLSRALEIGK